MPSISGYGEQRIQAPTPRGGGSRPAVASPVDNGIGALARGARDLLNVALDREEEKARAWAAEALSEARVSWTQHFIDSQSKWQPGTPDDPGFTPKILEDFDKGSDKALGAAPNEASRTYLKSRLADLRADLGAKAMVYEAQANIDYRRDQFKSAGNNLAKLMQADHTQYTPALAEQLAIIDASSMPPLAKSAAREELIQTVSTAAVWAQIQKSPTSFLQSVGFIGGEPVEGKLRKTSGDLKGITGNTPFDALPFEKRVQMFEAAVRQKSIIDGDADKAAKAARERLAEDGMKEAWARLDKRTLTSDYIESIRPVISDTNYKMLLDAHRRGPVTQDDPGTILEFTRLLYQNANSAFDFLMRAGRNGLVTPDTLRTESARAHSLASTSGPKNPYERERAWLAKQFDPGTANVDPIKNARFGDALRTFDDWVIANPNAKDIEVRKRAEEVLSQYQLFSLRDTVLALPTPRGTSIRRTPDKEILAADIFAAGVKLQKMRENRDLTDAEYQAEMQTLARWKRALEQ